MFSPPLLLPKCRDLTAKFIRYRESPHPRARPGGAVGVTISPNTNPLDEFKDTKPIYSSFVEHVQANHKQIKQLLKQLTVLHEERLKVSFTVDDNERDQKVQVLTDQISSLFQQSEVSLRKIALVGNSDKDPDLPEAERKIRINVMKRLAMDMQLLVKQFRGMQEKYLLRKTGLTALGSDIVAPETPESEPMSMDKLSPAAVQELKMLEDQGQIRHEEILRVTRTINELAQLWTQLNFLIVEQGGILDRIDKNIESALTNVVKGNVQLKQAEKESRAPKVLFCIVALFIVAIVLLIIIINKYSSSNSDSPTTGT